MVYRDTLKEGKEEKEKAILEYLPLVKKAASRLGAALPSSMEENDLIGCGIVGLLEAWSRYDPSRGPEFTAYAFRRIKGAMVDELRKLAWAPRSFFTRLRRVQEAEEKLRQQVQQEPAADDIAKFLGWSAREVKEVWRQCSFYSVVSLETVLFSDSEGESIKLEEVVSSGEETEAAVQEKEKIRLLAAGLEELPERDRLLLNLHYYEELTFKEIAGILKVSPARVSQLHARALQKLKKNLQKENSGYL